MPYSFLLLAVLLFSSCAKSDEPAPAPAAAVSYTDSSSKTSSLSTYRTTLSAGASLPSGAEMRFLTLHLELPDASQADLLYFYQGNSFPKTTGAVALYSNVNVAQYAGPAPAPIMA